MKSEKRIIISIMWMIIGIVLIGLGVANIIDSYWGTMGASLLGVGIIQMIRFCILNKNEAYREKREIEEKDERNHFLRNKAWAWTGYLFILIAAISGIIFKIVGQDLLSTVASGAVCLMMVLFWITYMLLKKKY